MATLTIRNVPDEVVVRLKKVAANKGHSMEQELRELLKTRFPARDEVLQPSSHTTDEPDMGPKRTATNSDGSTDQEAMELLKSLYPARAEVLERVRENWKNLPPVSVEDVDKWIAETWEHPV